MLATLQDERSGKSKSWSVGIRSLKYEYQVGTLLA